jgi:penicillin-binding protein 2D
MAEAYTAIVNMGNRVTPHGIVRVESAEGEVLWEPRYTPTRVLEPQVARLVLSLLEDAADRGTGGGIRSVSGLPWEIPVAGKTGTTNDNTDVWFIGATPDLQTTVWFGMDRPQLIATNATGGRFAAPVFGDFMRLLYVGDAEANGGGETPLLPRPERWPMLDLISREVDDKTGLLASQWCPAEQRYVEWYIPGTEPSEVCDESTRSRFPLRWW